MVTMKHLKKGAFRYLCRNCINKKYHVKLERRDCSYEYYPRMCEECKEAKHIVKDIAVSARWKLLFGRRD